MLTRCYDGYIEISEENADMNRDDFNKLRDRIIRASRKVSRRGMPQIKALPTYGDLNVMVPEEKRRVLKAMKDYSSAIPSAFAIQATEKHYGRYEDLRDKAEEQYREDDDIYLSVDREFVDKLPVLYRKVYDATYELNDSVRNLKGKAYDRIVKRTSRKFGAPDEDVREQLEAAPVTPIESSYARVLRIIETRAMYGAGTSRANSPKQMWAEYRNNLLRVFDSVRDSIGSQGLENFCAWLLLDVTYHFGDQWVYDSDGLGASIGYLKLLEKLLEAARYYMANFYNNTSFRVTQTRNFAGEFNEDLYE